MAGIYYAGGAFHYLDAVANENLAAYVAALGAGQRQYLVLSIDSAGAINVTEGTPKVGALDAEDIPDPPVGERALCAVDIRNGDTTIERERVYADLRFLAGGSTGGMALDDLSDVTVPAPDGGDALVWNDAASEWQDLKLLTDGNGDVVSDGNGDVLWG
jgi:hypothetical protein